MTEEQKYLFDLQGYIVLEDVVPESVVKACNKALDPLEDNAARGLSTATLSRHAQDRKGTLHLEYPRSRSCFQSIDRPARSVGCD